MYKISTKSIFDIFFFGYIVFRMTSLKFTLGLTGFSAFFNVLVFFLALFAIFFGLIKSKFDRQSAIFFLLCTAFIFTCILNLAFYWSVAGLAQTIEYILPWLALIMILVNRNYALANYKKYWSWFNHIIVILCFLGLFEYFALFIFGIAPQIEEITAGTGRYFVGYVSLIQVIVDTDLPYPRFLGPFIEAGDLGMWATVLLVYNLLRQRYAYVAILAVAIISTLSPAPIVSLMVALGAYIISRSLIGFCISFMVLSLAIFGFQDYILVYYTDTISQKALSLSERAQGFAGFWENIPYLLHAYPSGIPFFEDSAARFASGLAYSGTYSFVWAYEHGGVIALAIYLIVILYGFFVSCYHLFLTKSSLINNEIYIYYLMLFTYIVQRGTILEYAIVPLLFPIIFIKMHKNESRENTNFLINKREKLSNNF